MCSLIRLMFAHCAIYSKLDSGKQVLTHGVTGV